MATMAPATQRYRNPRAALGARGITQGANNGFWAEIGKHAGIDTSQPGWKRAFRQANPNADPNFLMNVAGGHIKRNASGGWTGFGRGPGGSGAVVNGVFDASGNPVSGDGGGEAGVTEWDFDANLNVGRGGASGAGGAGGFSGNLEDQANTLISGLMSGKEGPYTDDVVRRLTGSATARRAGDLANSQKAAYLAAVRGGTGASPGATATAAANAREARGALANDVGGIKTQATQGNFQAKLQGLEQAQASVQRTYQDRWNKATDATQRYQIEQEYDAAMKKIASEESLAEKSIGAAGAAAGRGRGWELEDRQAQWDREDFLYQRDLPLLATQLGLGSYAE